MSRLTLIALLLVVTVGGLMVVTSFMGPGESEAGREASVLTGRAADAATIRGEGDLPSGRSSVELPTADEDGGAAVRSLADDIEPIRGHIGPIVPRDGRTATLLAGVRRGGQPVAAEIEWIAGPERGARHALAATEESMPLSVYPGFALLEVRPAGGGSCRRQLLVDHGRETRLDLDFAERGFVHGTVATEDGTPVAGAVVSLDGVPTTTSNSGLFSCPVLVSGAPQLQVSARGFAPYRRTIPEARAVSGEPVDVELSPGSALTLRPILPQGGSGSGDITLYLLPTGGPLSKQMPLEPSFPWELVNPLTVPRGGSVRLEDLPACKLEVLAIGPGAMSSATTAFIMDVMDAGNTPEGQPEVELAVELKPLDTLSGRVVRAGEPVAGVPLSLRYANPMRATHRILGDHAKFTRRQPIEILPQVAQDVVTDADGRFAFGVDPKIGKPPFVTVRSEDGELSITREVDDTGVELLFDLARPGS